MEENIIREKRFKEDITNRDFGQLHVDSFAYMKNHRSYWNCTCSCGNTITVDKSNLLTGNTKSCGCTRSTSNMKGGVGEVFGDFELIKYDHTGSSGADYLVRCTKCGFEKVIARRTIVRGISTKCHNCGLPRSVEDLKDKEFGRLKVIKFDKIVPGRGAFWMCKCECGNEISLPASALKSGNTKSCGCLNIDSLKSRAIHGDWQDPLYNVYKGIKQRCYNPNSIEYHNYGGRGIKITGDWALPMPDGYLAFKRDMGSSYVKGLTIDRIDVNGNYCKENCRWANVITQANNRRDNTIVNMYDKDYTATQLATMLGKSPSMTTNRLRIGWSLDDALFIPPLDTMNKEKYKSENKIITNPICIDPIDFDDKK